MIDNNLFIDNKEKYFLELMSENIGFKDDIEEYYTEYIEKTKIPDLLGKSVKISEKQFRDVYKIAERICSILSIDIPDIYVYEDFYYGVESKGIKKYWIEISAKTIEDFSREELEFLLAKELYNIKFSITYYSTVIGVYLKSIDALNSHVTDIGRDTLKMILYKWKRISCFSSDNFGLIVSGNLKGAINSILLNILNNRTLVENIDIREYIKQGEEINKLNDKVYNYTKLDELVPYGPFRVKNLISYYSSERSREAKILIDNLLRRD